jgi:hypothetical protein
VEDREINRFRAALADIEFVKPCFISTLLLKGENNSSGGMIHVNDIRLMLSVDKW